MNFWEAVIDAYLLGHAWNPDFPDCANLTYAAVQKLQEGDELARQLLESRSRFQVHEYAQAVYRHHGREMPWFDGEYGAAAQEMAELPRCKVPDFAPPQDVSFSLPEDEAEVWKSMMEPAIGVGNWKGCHGVGNFHSASVRVNRSGIGSHLQPVFTQVLRSVQKAYAQVGVLFRFIENGKDMLTGKDFDGRINIEFSFVQRSNGWIGLAIVGQNQTCASNIWCRYLATYRPSDVVNEWITLIKHELGHNCGRGHTSGGVMNPGIIRGLPVLWGPSDPSYDWLRRQFGGEPVNLDDDGGDDGPPPAGLEGRVKQLETDLAAVRAEGLIKDAVQDVRLQILEQSRAEAEN